MSGSGVPVRKAPEPPIRHSRARFTSTDGLLTGGSREPGRFRVANTLLYNAAILRRHPASPTRSEPRRAVAGQFRAMRRAGDAHPTLQYAAADPGGGSRNQTAHAYRDIAPSGPAEARVLLLGTYPGSMCRYVGVNKGIPMLTVELESAEHMPTVRDANAIWQDMVDWLDARIGRQGKLAATGDTRPATLD
jgi:hypothetical protein